MKTVYFHMPKAMTLSIIAITSMPLAHSESSWHKSFDQEVQHMEKAFSAMQEHMNALGEEMEEAFTQETTTDLRVKIEEKETAATITIEQLKTDTVEATLNIDNDQLTIKAAEDVITLSVDNTFLTLSHTKEIKKENKKDGKVASFYASAGTYAMEQLLSGRVDLNKAEVNYDKKGETLTITLPYLDKKKNIKKLPVTMIGK